MASSNFAKNIAPRKHWSDYGARARQKSFENASKVDEILHNREMRVNNHFEVIFKLYSFNRWQTKQTEEWRKVMPYLKEERMI